MSPIGCRNVDNGEEGATADLPYARVAALPRLSLRHLMALTAATAVALAPMQFQQEFAQRVASLGPTVVVQPSLPTQIATVVWGIASGGCLFVAIALAIWRLQGFAPRLQPGHWLALQLASQWGVVAVFWLQARLSRDLNPFLFAAAAGPQFSIGLGFFIWFLYLALQRSEPLAWRAAYATLALAPIAGTTLGLALLFTTAARIGNIEDRVSLMLIPQFVATIGQGTVLAAAMASDARQHRPRHWTHWLVMGLKLLLLASMALTFAAMWIDPPQFRR